MLDFDITILTANWRVILSGLRMTLLICVISLPLGFVLGILLALCRISKISLLRIGALVLIELVRNVPFLVQIFMVFYVLPFYGIRFEPLNAGLGCLSVYGMVYYAEIIRGAILSVPRGQWEAAQALGLSSGTIMRKIIFPQTFGYLIPPTTNISITLIKESSVLSVITVAELTYIGQWIIGKYFAPVEMFSTIAIIYLAMTALFSKIMGFTERRLTRYARLNKVEA